MNASVRRILLVNSCLLALVALAGLIYPTTRAWFDLKDPALRRPGIPAKTWRLYRSLTPRYAAWARARVAGGQAQHLSTADISGTEWPLFGSVFYLWAMENLQAAWDAGDHSAGREPKVFARDAILAASDLVLDPTHATWVKQHWGDDYLHRENVFYRLLVIASLTSRQKLLGDTSHADLLRDQVESLARELEQSRSGLLDDYPGECYPGDVMAALAAIRAADALLDTNRLAFSDRALHAFIGAQTTRIGLPPYRADARTGHPTSPARGCANAYMCLSAPQLWPAQARQWFQLYEKFFWQSGTLAAGFREFANTTPGGNWTMDVDAGPVVAGYGVSANAFGTGAARRNGRFDVAFPLAAEMVATVGELPGGRLVVPRLLSNLSDAPLLGEAAVLWLLSIQPQKGVPLKTGGVVPPYAYLVIVGPFLLGWLLILEGVWRFRTARREPEREYFSPRLQEALWLGLVLSTLGLVWTAHLGLALALFLAALLLPWAKKAPRDRGNKPEDLPTPRSGDVSSPQTSE